MAKLLYGWERKRYEKEKERDGMKIEVSGKIPQDKET